MKRAVIVMALISVLMSAVMFAGCSLSGVITASGPVVSRDYDITDFTGIEAGSTFEVEVVPSNSYNITISANENLFDYLDVSKSGTTLRLGLKNAVNAFNFGPKTLKAKIAMPELWGLNLSGASRATALGFKSTHDFRLGISGASRFDMDLETGKFVSDLSGASRVTGSLKAGDSIIQLSGASEMEIQGSSGNTVIEVSGGSVAALSNFRVKDADVNISGGSRTSAIIDGKLDVNLSGGSTLEYAGNPTTGKIEVTGGSTLKRR